MRTNNFARWRSPCKFRYYQPACALPYYLTRLTMFRHQVGALKQFAKTLESEVSTISSFIRSQPHKRAPTAFHSRLTISTSTRHSVSQLRPGSQSQLLLNPLFTRSFDPIDLSQSALTACQQCQRRYGSKKAKGSQGKSKPGKRNKQADADFDEVCMLFLSFKSHCRTTQ